MGIMRVLITAGPTREYIDSVRFITNASSGRMGYAVAAAALAAGHRVTLLTGPVSLEPPGGAQVVRFVSVEDLKAALSGRFDDCDALVMSAAVGDFRPERRVEGKIPRSAGSVTVRLVATEDVLAGVARRKKTGQVVVAFAVEDAPLAEAEAKARAERDAKGADYVVVNTPAAMGADSSVACILGREGVVLAWGERSKDELAREIVRAILRSV